MSRFSRIAIVVLDSLGIGALPDAAAYGDAGADTVGHLTTSVGLDVPALAGLGLTRIARVGGTVRAGAFGRNAERSPAKDTTAGHWEMTGLIVDRPFSVFPSGFPDDFVDALTAITGRAPLGNEVASGTEIIARLGAEHQKSGRPILYTSADSVLQIAAHEETVPVATLHEWCARMRTWLLVNARVARVIARPFVGTPAAYKRTPNRRDYSVDPEGRTVLDTLVARGLPVIGVGKIRDIFNGRGITASHKSKDDMEGIDQTIAALGSIDSGLVFTNLVQLDQDFGHRRDAIGYRDQLQRIDRRIPELLAALRPDDLILFTGDHGNDPTFPGTDHTREYTPLLCYTPRMATAGAQIALGDRTSSADIAATIAENFACERPAAGVSFLTRLATA